jgi:hypothetical protein
MEDRVLVDNDRAARGFDFGRRANEPGRKRLMSGRDRHGDYLL